MILRPRDIRPEQDWPFSAGLVNKQDLAGKGGPTLATKADEGFFAAGSGNLVGQDVGDEGDRDSA